MDSIDNYSAAASKGGPAGEKRVTQALLSVLRSWPHSPSSAAVPPTGVHVDVATSDSMLADLTHGGVSEYDFFIFDRFTYAGKGWVLRDFLRDRVQDLFILDFFGREGASRGGRDADEEYRGLAAFPGGRVLTAFGNCGDGTTKGRDTFLGYFYSEEEIAHPPPPSNIAIGPEGTVYGVIWGKSVNYYAPQVKLLTALSSPPQRATFVSTLPSNAPLSNPSSAPPSSPSFVYVGHQTPQSFVSLLAGSSFLLGLGHPLSGPTALDAVAYGAVYINPTYRYGQRREGEPSVKGCLSQHDLLRNAVGATETLREEGGREVRPALKDRVCEYVEGDVEGALRCIERAIDPARDRTPFIPSGFSEREYRLRVHDIFAKYLPEPKGL